MSKELEKIIKENPLIEHHIGGVELEVKKLTKEIEKWAYEKAISCYTDYDYSYFVMNLKKAFNQKEG
jgi:hypothetical protein